MVVVPEERVKGAAGGGHRSIVTAAMARLRRRTTNDHGAADHTRGFGVAYTDGTGIVHLWSGRVPGTPSVKRLRSGEAGEP